MHAWGRNCAIGGWKNRLLTGIKTDNGGAQLFVLSNTQQNPAIAFKFTFNMHCKIGLLNSVILLLPPVINYMWPHKLEFLLVL